MAADLEKLKGQVQEPTDQEADDYSVERLMIGLLRSLLEEQKDAVAKAE